VVLRVWVEFFRAAVPANDAGRKKASASRGRLLPGAATTAADQAADEHITVPQTLEAKTTGVRRWPGARPSIEEPTGRHRLADEIESNVRAGCFFERRERLPTERPFAVCRSSFPRQTQLPARDNTQKGVLQ
jgi:hypothetical protein